MNDKVIIELIVPEIDEKYDIFLPINKRIGSIVLLLNKAVNELSQGDFPISRSNKLYNANNLSLYNPNDLLIKTDIRNGTKLLLFSK